MLSIRFWGVRGSIPCPGQETVIYGGNTSCIEMRADERLIIIDMGTGLRPLGDWLLRNDFKKNGKIKAEIFSTHTHWDHIMGFPMFAPVYIKGTELRVTAPITFENKSIKDIVEDQFSYSHWPVRAEELAAQIIYNQIKEEIIDLGGGLTVKSKYLNHPISTLGYRFEYQGKSIATVYDHEPFSNLFAADPVSPGFDKEAAMEGERAAAEENEKILQFIQGADVLIHDAQYSKEEYQGKRGWGHASCEHALQAAKSAGVKKLLFFHHEPAHTDSQLEQIEKIYSEDPDVQAIMAKEGMVVEV